MSSVSILIIFITIACSSGLLNARHRANSAEVSGQRSKRDDKRPKIAVEFPMFGIAKSAPVPPVIPERPRLKRSNIYGAILTVGSGHRSKRDDTKPKIAVEFPMFSVTRTASVPPVIPERPRLKRANIYGVILTELSGYRIKRDNAYGDEPTLPLAANDEYEAAVPVEEAPVATGQSMPDLANASVASSGY